MTFVHDLTKKLEENRELISDWMSKNGVKFTSIYGSVDIRDAGWKVVIDANHFPAGLLIFQRKTTSPCCVVEKSHQQKASRVPLQVHLYPESRVRLR